MASGPQTTGNGQIVRTDSGNGGLFKLLDGLRGEIERALPKHISGDRMARVMLTALRTTPKLAQCTPHSFAGCIMTLAQLGLEPNTPLQHAFLIPRENRRKGGILECTTITGYQGFIELVRRSGLVSSVYGYAVKDGDKFSYRLGLDPDIEHVPSDDQDREEKRLTHTYAVAKMRDSGDKQFIVLTRAQIEKRRLRSSSAGASHSPWKSDYDAMALKSAVRALWPWLPKSPEMARVEALEVADETGKRPQLDPDVAEILASRGLIEDADVVDEESDAPAQLESGEQREHINLETGEVTNGQQSLDGTTAPAKKR